MDSYVVTVLPGGRITIPAAIRRDLGLKPGDTLEYWREGRDVVLRKAQPGEPALISANTDDSKAANTPERSGQ